MKTLPIPDYQLNMVGEPCPYPAVATLEAMPQLAPGEVLEVITDCPQSINNIPLDAQNHGYKVLAGGCETGWMYRAVEGQIHFWWVGLGNILGATLLAYLWDDLAPVLALPYQKVNLLTELGPLGGLALTYGLLLLALLAILLWERRFFRRLQSNPAPEAA